MLFNLCCGELELYSIEEIVFIKFTKKKKKKNIKAKSALKVI